MRVFFLPLALAAAAAPADAQSPSALPSRADPSAEIARHIADPATAEKLARTMQALGKAMLELPVGEIKAAVEGRAVTSADKRLTVRDLGRRDDPQFDRKFSEQLANAGPMMQQGLKALGSAMKP